MVHYLKKNESLSLTAFSNTPDNDMIILEIQQKIKNKFKFWERLFGHAVLSDILMF